MTVESYRPRCYLDIEIDHEPIGRIVAELFAEICPNTSENFRCLCTGEKGLGKISKKPLSYKGTLFHRVIKNFVIQSGDFESGNGTGGESIFGGQFNDENFLMKHDKPFLLSMANKGRNTNGSQFFITTQPTPHLDGKHTVFGHIISGHEVISAIENLKTDQNSRPLKEVKITQCGELVLKSEKKKRHRESSSDSSSEEEKRRKKKKKKHKKEKKASKEKKTTKNRSLGNNEEEDGACSIDPEEIPAIPANNFLMRRTSPMAEFRRTPRVRESYNYKRRPPSRSRSGRKMKGRGNMRYRTPESSDERSGSETPPHWKQAQSRLKSLKDVIPKKDNSPSDEMSVDDYEDGHSKNPFLQSRLGLVSTGDSRRRERDSRVNIDENRRNRGQSHEGSPRRGYREHERKIDLFEQLLEDNAKHGKQWFQEQSPKQKSKDDNHTSPLRSKIVVKSNITSGNFREKEGRNEERGSYRMHDDNSRRRDSISNKRSHSFHYDSNFGQDNSHRRSDDRHHWTEKRKETNRNTNDRKNEKPLSPKSQKRFTVLANDLLRYSKHDFPKKKKEKSVTQPKSDKQDEKLHTDVTQDDCILQKSIQNNVQFENLSTIQNYHKTISEKFENAESNESAPASESFKLQINPLEESVINKPEKILIDVTALNNDNESACPQVELKEHSVSLQNIVNYSAEKDSDLDYVNDSYNSDNLSDHLLIPVPEKPPADDYNSDGKLGSPPAVHEDIIDNDNGKSDLLEKPSYDCSFPDIIPLPDEGVNPESVAIIGEEKQAIGGNEAETDSRDKNDKKSTDNKFEENILPVVSPEDNRDELLSKKERKATEHSHEVVKPTTLVDVRTSSRSPSQEPQPSVSRSRDRSPKSPVHHYISKKRASKSPNAHKDAGPSSSRRSRSPISRRSKSPSSQVKSPISRRNKSNNDRRSKSRSRSRSARRSISRNRGRRRYSRSPDVRQRRSRSHPRNTGRGTRSYRYLGARNRSPDRRGSFQRRYNKSPPYRGRARARSASRRSDTRSRSRSIDKRRRRRRQSTSSSSSSSSSSRSESVKKRNIKNSAKGRKKRSSSSSTTSSRSKRSDST